MRFDVPDARGRDARVAICHPQRLELAALPRSHRAFAAAVVVRRCAPDDRVDAVAVPDRIVEALEDDRAGAFSHEESVGGRIEGTAFTGAGDGPDAAEADQIVGEQVQVHTAGDREIDLAGAQVDDGLLRGHQRGRAGGVDGKRGAAQVPGLRDDGGGHVEQVPGHGEGAHRHHVLDQRVAQLLRFRSRQGAAERTVEELHHPDAGEEHFLVLADAGADEHARAGAFEEAPLIPRVLKRCPDGVEHQAMLWIRHLDPARSDPVVQGSELAQFLVLEVGALVDVRLVGDPRGRIVESRVVPARRRDAPEGDRTAADQLPVREWVPGPGESAPQPDDRYLQTASETACRATFKAL